MELKLGVQMLDYSFGAKRSMIFRYYQKSSLWRPNERAGAFVKSLILLVAAGVLFSSTGCMTGSVIHDARYPNPNDAAPWGNYLLLPITIPADIATSPIQAACILSAKQGCHVSGAHFGTNANQLPARTRLLQ